MGGACRAPVPTCPRFLPPRHCAYNPGFAPVPALLRRLPLLPGFTGKKFRASLVILGSVPGIPERERALQGVGTGRPPSDRVVGGKIEADARVPVTHMFLLPKEPSKGNKSQDLRSRGSIEVPSDFPSWILCAAKAPSRDPESPEGWGLRVPLPGSDSLFIPRPVSQSEARGPSPSCPLGAWACGFLPSLRVPCSGGHADPAYRPRL